LETGGNSKKPSPIRLAHVAAMVIIGASFGGFYIGTRPAAYQPVLPEALPRTPPAGEVTPAITYSEHPLVKRGPNADWPRPFEEMLAEAPAEAILDEAAKLASLAKRAETRAFNGAPPVIPHPVENMKAMDCMVCHDSGLHLGDQFAPAMSHDFFASCTQCHAPVGDHVPGEFALAVENHFQGIPAPTEGDRAWEGAPPTIPHTTHMRQNCLACHGYNGWPGLHTTHPERQDCRQCHASDAGFEQHVSAFRLYIEGSIHGP